MVRDWRPEHPAVAVLGDQLLNIGAAVVRFNREFAAKGGFRITLEDREIQLALIADSERFIVGDQFGAKAEHEQHQKQVQ